MAKGPYKSVKDRENHIAEFVLTQVRIHEETTVPDRNRWETAAALFAGKQDFGPLRQENDALAQVFMHVFSKIVRNAASSIQDIIHGNADFYEIEPPDDEPTVFTEVVKKFVKYRIEELKLPQHTYKFAINGGIFGLGVNKLWLDRRIEKKPEIVTEEKRRQTEDMDKSLPSQVQTPIPLIPDGDGMERELRGVFDELFGQTQNQRFSRKIKVQKKVRFQYKIRTIDPVNYFFEPGVDDVHDSPWQAERAFVKFYQLKPLFDAGVLNKARIKDILKGGSRTFSSSSPVTDSSSAEGQSWRRKDQYRTSNPYTPELEVIEYFGPLLAKGDEQGYEQGEIIEEDCWFVVINGQVVAKDAKTPFWFANSPYYESVFCPMPSKAVGAGVADNAMDQQILINQIWSLYLDHLTFTILGVKGINVDALDDPSQVKGGLVPGQVLFFNSTHQKVADAMGDVDYNPNLAFPIVQVMEKLELAGESAAGVDVTSANPTARSRISATEVDANRTRSDRSQFSLARELDSSYIEETVRRVLGMVLQFDFEEQILQEYLEQKVISQSEYQTIIEFSRLDRFKEATRNYKIRVKGFRERLERSDELSRIVEFAQQINQIPESRDKVNWGEFIEVLSEKYNIPADRIVFQTTPQDRAREENAILRESRMVEVKQEDQHGVHLLIHYEQITRSPNEAVRAHVMAHIQMAQEAGAEIPTPSPEIADFLGLEVGQQEVPRKEAA